MDGGKIWSVVLMRVGIDPGPVFVTSYTYELSATLASRSAALPDGPHDHDGADGERADSGRRAACPDCFPLIDCVYVCVCVPCACVFWCSLKGFAGDFTDGAQGRSVQLARC